MTTSDERTAFGGIEELNLAGLDLPGASLPLPESAPPGVPPGFPDPQLLAVWANELFKGSHGPQVAAHHAGAVPALPPTAAAAIPFNPQQAAQYSYPGAPGVVPSAAAGAAFPANPSPIGTIASPGSPSQGLAASTLASQALPFGTTYPGNPTTLAAASAPANPQPLAAGAPAFSPGHLPSDGSTLYFLQPGAGFAPSGQAPTPAASQTFPQTSEPAMPTATPTISNVGATRADAPSPAGLPDLGLGDRLFDANTLRADFPILSERVNGRPLIWLDNAATTQKPQSVIDRISHFYEHENSNIHRAAHTLAARSTDAYEAARDKVRKFLNAPSPQTIVFTRGTTEAINLVAQSWGRRNIRSGDEIIISWLEHHSNIVPWQLLALETGAKLRVAPVDDDGQILLAEYERLFNPRTRLVSFTQVSNALGTITPAREMIEIAHRYGARVLLDGAQAVSHMPVDVQALDADFYVFSGHKVFGPTGIGALYGKSEVLESMPPWQGGGNMIADVTFERTVFHAPPMRFEAGTGNIADAVGLGAAIDYVERIGMTNIASYEHSLLEYGTAKLLEVPRLRLIGTARDKASVLSFVIDGIPSEQVGAALAQEGIAVRAGHHCAQPALRRFGLESSVRPSLAFYNTRADIDALVSVLKAHVSTRTVN